MFCFINDIRNGIGVSFFRYFTLTLSTCAIVVPSCEYENVQCSYLHIQHFHSGWQGFFFVFAVDVIKFYIILLWYLKNYRWMMLNEDYQFMISNIFWLFLFHQVLIWIYFHVQLKENGTFNIYLIIYCCVSRYFNRIIQWY